eukprot:2610499-Prymnesium_polylepis.1
MEESAPSGVAPEVKISTVGRAGVDSDIADALVERRAEVGADLLRIELTSPHLQLVERASKGVDREVSRSVERVRAHPEVDALRGARREVVASWPSLVDDELAVDEGLVRPSVPTPRGGHVPPAAEFSDVKVRIADHLVRRVEDVRVESLSTVLPEDGLEPVVAHGRRHRQRDASKWGRRQTKRAAPHGEREPRRVAEEIGR